MLDDEEIPKNNEVTYIIEAAPQTQDTGDEENKEKPQ